MPTTAPSGGVDLLWRANEPAGMTRVTDNLFQSDNSVALGAAWAAWDDQNPGSPYHSNLADATAPSGTCGPNVEQIRWPAGVNVGGGAPSFADWNIVPNYKHIYLCYWFKYSSNWDGNVDGINKHGYVWSTMSGGTPSFVYEVEGTHSSDMITRSATQFAIVDPNSDHWYPQNLQTVLVTRNVWHLNEILLTGNTAGTADGGIDGWLDGVHTTSGGGLQWTTADTAWAVGRVYPVFGGASSQTLSAEQFWWLARYYMSGKN